MGFWDSARETTLKLAEERLGISVLPTDELSGLREGIEDYRALSAEAEELAYRSLDYFNGQPSELRLESRRNLSQRSRVAFMKDPLAGTEAEHYANFSLGRGIGKPRAPDKEVQKIIDEAWEDANNVDKLVGYDALRSISNELRAGTNLFPVAFIRNGRVKISFLDADRVEAVVTDPDDELRPIYYMAKTRKRDWDYDNDRAKIEVTGEVPKTIYFKHWQNVELIDAERKENGEEKLEAPPAGKIAKGVVHHVRTNRLLFQQFGTPYWSRTLRFMQALNKMMEARVSMAMAASSFIAKRVMQGGPSEVIKSAESVIKQTGEIGAIRPVTDPLGRQAAPPPASFWNENQAHRLEPLQLNTGASGAETDSRLIRSSATVSSMFGPHYFSDPGNSNLATASALELPTLMAVGAWQELLQGLLRWFTDLVIQEAVRAGRLGGSVKDVAAGDGMKPLRELVLSEAEDKQEAEKRTGKDLSYELTMPYPGRRDLQAVVAAFTSVLTQLSPIGENEDLTKIALQFLFTHGFELEDPVDAAEKVYGSQKKLLQNQAQMQAEQAKAEADQAAALAAQPPTPGAPGTPQPGAPSSALNTDRSAGPGKSQYGERKNGTATGGALGEGVSLETQSLLDGLMARVEQALSTGVLDPGVAAAAQLNGHGGSGGSV